MSEFSKTARRRLAANQPRQHPEADLLNAFAERTLTARERAQVTEHLSVCADCRDVVAITAAAASESAVVAPQPTFRAISRLAWLRWAAPVATMAVIALALFVRNNEFAPINQRHDAEFNRERAESANQTLAKNAPKPSSPSAAIRSEPSRKATATQPEGLKRAEAPASAEADSRLATSANEITASAPSAEFEGEKKETSGNSIVAFSKDKHDAPAPAPPPSAATLTASNSNLDGFTSQTAKQAKTREPRPQIANAAPAPAASAPSGAASVAASTGAVTSSSAGLSAQKAAEPRAADEATALSSRQKASSRTDRNPNGYFASGPVAVASVAPTEQFASKWRVAGGKLQRQTSATDWQTVNVNGQTFTVSASLGSDVWAGGKSASMVHSADAGAHWQSVTIAADGKPATADVTAIRLAAGAVSADLADHSHWRSLDQGKTWIKAAE